MSGPRVRIDQPRRASTTPNASRPIVCRSFGPQASTSGNGRNGAGAIADWRASHTRTASVARCSCAVSQTPAFHRLPISRIAGKATSRIVSSTPIVSVPDISVSRSLRRVELHRRFEEPIEQLGPRTLLRRVAPHDVDGLARRVARG